MSTTAEQNETATQAQPKRDDIIDYFNATRGHDLDGQAGRLTLEHAVGLFDAIGAVRVCCYRAMYAQCQGEIPAHWQTRLDRLNDAGKMSIAKARRILGAWHRATHQFWGEAVPDASAVQNFLWTVNEM